MDDDEPIQRKFVQFQYYNNQFVDQCIVLMEKYFLLLHSWIFHSVRANSYLALFQLVNLNTKLFFSHVYGNDCYFDLGIFKFIHVTCLNVF